MNKINLLDLQAGLVDKETNEAINEFKALISKIVKIHKGSGKNKNYTIEFNKESGVYSILYKEKEFATIKTSYKGSEMNHEITTEEYITNKL